MLWLNSILCGSAGARAGREHGGSQRRAAKDERWSPRDGTVGGAEAEQLEARLDVALAGPDNHGEGREDGHQRLPELAAL